MLKHVRRTLGQPLLAVLLLAAGCSDSDTTTPAASLPLSDSSSTTTPTLSQPEPPKEPSWIFDGRTMGTTYHVKVDAPTQSLDGSTPDEQKLSESQLGAKIQSALDSVNNAMSTYKDDSELMIFNNQSENESFAVSADLANVIAVSLEVAEQTNGALDISVGPLIELWGFGKSVTQNRVPTDAQIEAALKKTGVSALTLSNGMLSKSKAIRLDLSAVAKGFAVDKVASLLRDYGFNRFMVEVGGEIKVGAPKVSGDKWVLAIEKPVSHQRSIQQIIETDHIAVATSGNYRNFFERGGKRYAHFIDPRTGRPVEHSLASVTVLHPDAAYADAYATAFSVLGVEPTLALADKLNIPVYLIEMTDGDHGVNFTTKYSRAFEPYL